MMFEDVISDIEKMIGIGLKSIKKASSLTIIEVDRENKRIELISGDGELSTRPFSELEKVWEGLCSYPAVHVDSALRGSGSRRNQPETIMANLPYIEWLMYEKRKHLAFVGKPSHKYGTILEMGEDGANKVRKELIRLAKVTTEIVIIANDMLSVVNTLENLTGNRSKSFSSGSNEIYKDNVRYIITSRELVPKEIAPGTYIVMEGNTHTNLERLISIGEESYEVLNQFGLNIMLKSLIK
ncbi:hypothetical protein [Paenibacillus glycanilyticus]|uniref:hypothetical protein n=1 Tax=Paenibacillus glycanilyticus TaxID=126569 RepID=UPI003EB868F7